MTSATGWRHVYTWSRRGALGAPGFQTVARSRDLEGDRLRALERQVAALRPPPGVERPSLFLQPSPTDAGRSVLTRSVATGRSADGRPGGFVAESVVVPDRWLEAAEWDLGAAFAGVSWRDWSDAEDAAIVPDEELPPLTAPDEAARRKKLARLDRLLPDPELRAALLETLIWQAEDGGRDEPIHLVADPDTAPEDFEALVLLLPLALRPEERVRAAEGRPGERRGLRLGTLAAPGSLDRPDLLGVPDALLEEARRAPGVVVDLGGRIPPPRPGDERVRERARRVSRDLNGEGTSVSEAADDDQERDGTSGMSLDEAPRLEDTGDASGSDPLAERAAAWRLRDESEARVAALLDRLRADHDRMIEPLKRLVEAERQRFGDEIEGMKRELSEVAEEARVELAREADRGRRQLQEEGERRKGVLRGQLDTRVEELDRYQEELLDRLSEEEVRAERRLRDAAGLAAIPSDRREPPKRRTEAERRPDRKKRDAEDRGPLAPREPGGGAWKSSAAARPGLRERLADQPAAVRWGAPIALLALLAISAYFMLWRGNEAPTPGEEELPAAAATAPAGETAGAAELRARAVARLRDGATAGALLSAAAASPEPAVQDAAAAARLVLALDAGLGETASCALLQQVLSDRRVEAGLSAIAVDGVCGTGTRTVLSNAAANVGCAGASWQEEGACVVNRTLAGGEPACAASWPLRRSCGWSTEEGRRALALVRRMPADLRQPVLAVELAGRQLSERQAAALVPLAWASAEAATGRSVPDVPAPGSLDEDRLRAALESIDRLGGAPG